MVVKVVSSIATMGLIGKIRLGLSLALVQGGHHGARSLFRNSSSRSSSLGARYQGLDWEPDEFLYTLLVL